MGMTSTTSSSVGSARRTVGVLRLAAGLLVLAAIVTQISDQLGADAFVPAEYFSYFTIQSSMMNVVVLLVGGAMALTRASDSVLYTGVRAAAVVYAVVTAAVYNGLLRGAPPAPDQYIGVQWPNEVEHVWIPIFLLIDWIFSTGRARLGWRWLLVVVAYPLAWCAYTLLHGAIGAWYPYPFIDPATAGWASVVAYIVGLAGFMVVLGALAVKWTRSRAARSMDAPA